MWGNFHVWSEYEVYRYREPTSYMPSVFHDKAFKCIFRIFNTKLEFGCRGGCQITPLSPTGFLVRIISYLIHLYRIGLDS